MKPRVDMQTDYITEVFVCHYVDRVDESFNTGCFLSADYLLDIQIFYFRDVA